MSINHEKKLIFINIPKNAGTSIIEAMGVENALFDISMHQYKRVYENYWDSYLKFSVVRNPFDRFVSAYKHIRMKDNPNQLLRLSRVLPTGEIIKLDTHPSFEKANQMDVNGFVDYLYRNMDEHTFFTYPQSSFICDRYNKIQVDKLIRYENLVDDLKEIGIYNLKRLNKSSIFDESKIKLNDRSKRLLYHMYEIDFKKFDYKNLDENYE
jgi:hypothetical protein